MKPANPVVATNQQQNAQNPQNAQNAQNDKKARRDRGQAVEAEIHRIFRDRSKSVSERAEMGLSLLTGKLSEDLQEQTAQVTQLQASGNRAYADQEISRLLRMLDKRKKLIDRIQALLDSPLAAAQLS